MDESPMINIQWYAGDSFAEVVAPCSEKWLYKRCQQVARNHPNDCRLQPMKHDFFKILMPVQYIHIFVPSYMRNAADDAERRHWEHGHPRHE